MIHSERSIVFETINGNQLHFFMDQWDQILVVKYTSVREITILYDIIPNARKRSGIFPFCLRSLNLVTKNSKKPFICN